MIRINGKEIVVISRGNVSIQTVYKGAIIVWQAIRSCFGAGYWVNEKPWLNSEGWKN